MDSFMFGIFMDTSLSIDLRVFGLTLGLVWTRSGNLLAHLQLELTRQRLGWPPSICRWP